MLTTFEVPMRKTVWFSGGQVIRVYIGSFWSHPLLIPDNRKLFEAEEQDLFKDIQSLPRNAALRKLNDLIKRARLAKVKHSILQSIDLSVCKETFYPNDKKQTTVGSMLTNELRMRFPLLSFVELALTVESYRCHINCTGQMSLFTSGKKEFPLPFMDRKSGKRGDGGVEEEARRKYAKRTHL